MREARTSVTRYAVRPRGRRSGIVLALTAIGLLALLAFMALALDIGREVLSIQRCQSVADVSALAGGAGLPVSATAKAYVVQTVQGNNTSSASGLQVSVNPASDITIYGPNSTKTGIGGIYENLGPGAYVLKVTGRMYVPFYFATLFGINGADVSRPAYVYVGPVSGTLIGPIWMWYENGAYQPGVVYNVYEGQLGQAIQSFGLAAFANGSSSTIAQYLEGNNLSQDQIDSATFNLGDTLPVTNGNHGGAWKMGFYDKPDGRLYRASLPPYDTQTPDNYTSDNPRILIVPLLHGDPSSGTSTIDAFGAFWVISADFNGNHSQMSGEFLSYVTVPTGVPDPGGTGTVNTIKLIK
jgi:hypothetical protein